jgi:recombination protein RecT
MRGDPIAAYAVAIHATGHAQCDVMWKEEIEKIMDRVKARAKNWEKSPWVSDPDEMWKKTAVKRLCKLLPQSQELARAIEYDNEVEGVIDHTPAPEPSAIDKAKARLRATSATLDTEIPTAAEQEEIAKAEAKS